MNEHLYELAKQHLRYLCVEVAGRHLGSTGNRASTRYVEEQFGNWGLRVELQEFPCLEWEPIEQTLRAGQEPFALHASPYTWPCDAQGPLRVIRSLEDLDDDVSGAVLLIQGELAARQLAPKAYPFYSVQEHQRLIERLEKSGALAVIAATGKDPMSTAALSPFPLIEDGDFALPSAYLSLAEGERLAARQGQIVSVRMQVIRRQSCGFNVVGHIGSTRARHIVCAHIDAKRGSPGAVDNASGTTVLLLLAELLRDFDGVELVAFNGEDDYSAAGERAYLKHRADLTQTSLVINVDGIGFHAGATAFSTYGFAASREQQLDQLLLQEGLRKGPQWIQSDHAVFIQQGVPAIAMTTTEFSWAWANIAHTERDRIELVDPAQLVQAAEAIRKVVRSAVAA